MTEPLFDLLFILQTITEIIFMLGVLVLGYKYVNKKEI